MDGKTIYGNYIDRTGRLLIPFQYDTIAPYVPGYLRAVRRNGKWGFLDSLANVAVAPQYDDIDADSLFFWQNRRRVGLAGRWGFMDGRSGRIVVPIRYGATRPSQSAFVWVRQNGRWGCLNARNHVVIPFRYADAQPFDPSGLAAVRQHKTWGVVDTSGRIVAGFRYDTVFAFREGRAMVGRAGRFGFIDPAGREVVPIRYKQLSPSLNGRAFANSWGLFVTLDRQGRWVGVKLQTATLNGLLIVLVGLVAAEWFRRRYRHRQFTHPQRL